MRHILLIISGLIFISCHSSQNLTTASNYFDEEMLDTLVISSERLPKEEKHKAVNYRPSQKRNFDLLHTTLHLSFDMEKRLVHGKALLDMKPYFYDSNLIELDAVNFKIKKLSLLKEGVYVPLDFDYDSRRLVVFLDRIYNRDENIRLSIEYIANPEKDAVEQFFSIGSDQGLFFIDPEKKDPSRPTQIWTQGETEYNSRWFPTFDQPNERCTQDIYLTVDSVYTTLSNGILVDSSPAEQGMRTDHWKMELPHAPYLFSVVVGDYSVVGDKWGDIDLAYYVYPEYGDIGSAIFKHTPEMLSFFSDLTGVEYPWSKYSQVIVSDFVSGAMENTTAVTFAESFQKGKEELVDYPNDLIVAHEMAHHWFGNLVTCESWANITLNEGFANYAEYLWTEYKYGYEAAELHRYQELNTYINSTRYSTHPLIRFEYDHKDGLFDAHSYNKGGLVLHMLRKYIGDDAFWRGVNKYLIDNSFDSAEAHDLRMAFEAVCGEDLNWFFNQWFYSEGHPILRSNYSYDDKNNKLIFVVEQVQEIPSLEVFSFPMEYSILTKDGALLKDEVWINMRAHQFEIELDSEPVALILNSNHAIPCQLNTSYNQAELLAILSSDCHIVDRYTAIQQLKHQRIDAAIFVPFLRDDCSKIRRSAIEAIGRSKDEVIVDRMKQLASSDPDPIVRSKALRALLFSGSALEVSYIEDLIRRDSSANVIATCLKWLNDNEAKKAVAYAEIWQKSLSQGIRAVVAEIFSNTDDPAYLGFFEKAISRANIYELVPLVMSYGRLLEKQEADVLYGQLSALHSMAKESNYDVIKLGVIRSLIQQQVDQLKHKKYLLSQDGENVKALQKYIRKTEKLLDL